MKNVILVIILLLSLIIKGQETDMELTKLNAAEKRIIEDKGTEAPFTGEYWNFFGKGIYKCRRCGNALYNSEDKFSSGCGWPSFDDEIKGAVRRQTDADGTRTEILCSSCGAHLGHVFTGEKFTEKDTRHCVNSLSLHFEAEPSKSEVSYIAGGCFWGVEYYLNKMKGVISTESGYMGGNVQNPEYHQVSTGITGHAETVRVIFDPEVISYEEILIKFFEIHDPTQVNRQGPDHGSQYRSSIFYDNENQKNTALKLIKILQNNGYNVVTELKPAQEFWIAEKYHQDYYDKKGGTPYCHRPVKRFD
ncbi:MAG: bifunctional methionine sulfoxide reductase B/A protein [Candidatus Cloacimonetes bacterium]|nr:bifunctional methionine sulfoxide reductase B/A protein [Candidatus Cloacimonadota bacterium]